MSNLILFNKPFGVLSQFTDTQGRPTLADYLDALGYRVAGRLDYDSEGLLLLTDSGQLQHAIASPDHKRWKTYQVQVEGTISAAAIEQLQRGVTLKDGPTRAAKAKIIDPPSLWLRSPPIRVRQSVPDSWLQLSISEGRNRQVRRMTAAVGFPTLRLVRVSVGEWALAELQPTQHIALTVAVPLTKHHHDKRNHIKRRKTDTNARNTRD